MSEKLIYKYVHTDMDPERKTGNGKKAQPYLHLSV